VKFFKFLFLAMCLSQVALANDLIKYETVVVDHVIEVYSEGWDDDQFVMAESDIWGLEFADNEAKYCLATISGFASRPSYRGSALYKFWVCVTEPIPGVYEAEILDDMLLGEAD
jgi:hypothetical protein